MQHATRGAVRNRIVGLGSALALAATLAISADSAVGAATPQSVSPPAGEAIVNLTPERFVDTRPGFETLDGEFEGIGKRGERTEFRVQIAGRGDVPADAAGVIANVTAVEPVAAGHVRIHPCVSPRPETSSLNYPAGVNLGNEVISALDATGGICLFVRSEAHITLDVVGYVPADSAVTPTAPGRFFETRPGIPTVDGTFAGGGRTTAGGTEKIRIAGRGDIPADIDHVIANVTAVNPLQNGFLVAHACLPTRPPTSSLNHRIGVNRGNELLIPVDENGDICIFTLRSIDLTVDVLGYVPPGTNITSIEGTRLVDTRPGFETVDGLFAGTGLPAAESQLRVQVAGRGDIPANATSVVVNLTAVDPAENGFIVVHPCALLRPNASSLNYTTGVTGGNEIIAGLNDAGELCIFTKKAVHYVLDATAYITPANRAPEITSAAAFNAAENQTAVATLTATDADVPAQTLTWSETGGADAGLLSISAGGVLTFDAAPDFENPGDANTDNVYEIDVQVSDGAGGVDTQSILVTVTDVVEGANNAPTITSDGGGDTAAVNAAEHQTAVTDVDSTDDNDAEGSGLTYSLTTASGGGVDNDAFTLDAATGVLTFTVAPDFENPGDDDTDNDYEVQVTVTDSGALTDVQDITVTVTDVPLTVTELLDNAGGLNGPVGVAVDSSGNVFVASRFTDNVFRITPTGATSVVIDGAGDGVNVLDSPRDVAVDATGNLYVTGFLSDNAFKVTPAGVITQIIDATGDGGGNTLDEPDEIAVDASGTVYVAGSGSDNAFSITSGGTITEIIDSTGDGSTVLSGTSAIAVDSSSNVFVASQFTDSVFQIASGGGITQIIDATGDGAGNVLDSPRGLAVDDSGNVYVTGGLSDNAFQIAGAVITEIIDATGDGGGNVLDTPEGIAVDAAGNVYVAGSVSDNAFQISTGGTTEIIDATGDGGGNILDTTTGIAVAPSGIVYVTGFDSDNLFSIVI